METPTSEDLKRLAEQSRVLRRNWDRAATEIDIAFIAGGLYEFAEQAARALDACAEAMRWVPVREFEGSSKNVVWLCVHERDFPLTLTQLNAYTREGMVRDGAEYFLRLPPLPAPPSQSGE